MKKRILVFATLLFLSVCLLTACSSSGKATKAATTADYCNTTSGVGLPPVQKKASPAPAPGTPVGGDFRERR